jgi:hypothetical protein
MLLGQIEVINVLLRLCEEKIINNNEQTKPDNTFIIQYTFKKSFLTMRRKSI